MRQLRLIIVMLALAIAAPTTLAQTVGGGSHQVRSFEGLGNGESIDMAASRITIGGEQYKLASDARYYDVNGQPVNPAEMGRGDLVRFVFEFGSLQSTGTFPSLNNGVVTELRIVAPDGGVIGG